MNRLESTTIVFLCVAPLMAIGVVPGCSMPTASDFKPSKLFSLGDDDEPKKGTPVRLVGTWTDTVKTQAGQPSQRGFGGRLVFYGRKEERPILVDGQLVVYAFDETGRAVTDNRPTRRYVFPPDQLPLHMSKSELGASYSFWLPWDEVGGSQTEVSLICRFEPKGGAIITSEQTRHLLPGNIPPDSKLVAPQTPKLPEGVPARPAQATLESLQATRDADRGVQQASYQDAETARRMTTTSITLPKNFQMPAAPPRTLHSTQQVTPTSVNALPATGLPATALPASQLQPAGNTLSTPAAPTSNPNASIGITPTQPTAALRTAPPAMYSPMSGGFRAVAQQQPTIAMPAPQMMPQTAPQTAPQPVPSAWPAAQRLAWNRLQPGQSPLLGQYQTLPADGQRQIITQPASQPLPPPSGITTTVTPPPQAALLR